MWLEWNGYNSGQSKLINSCIHGIDHFCKPVRPVGPARSLREDDRNYEEDDQGPRNEDDLWKKDGSGSSPARSSDGDHPSRSPIPPEGETEKDINVPDQVVRLVGEREMNVPRSSTNEIRNGLITPVRLGQTTADQAGHEGYNLLLDDRQFVDRLLTRDNNNILCPATLLPVTVRRELMMDSQDESSTVGVCPVVIPDRYWAHAVTSTPEPSMGKEVLQGVYR